MTPLTAQAAIDRYYLETRCKLIEIAANLDRIDRGDGAAGAAADPRMAKVLEALALLNRTDITTADRAERLQRVFSQQFEEGWAIPNKK